jgi:uncharacterized protein YndB with AHSA1/START domain
MSELRFVPRTAYVIYIASTPERVWEALTGPEFTRQYFSGRSVEIEPKVGGSFVMRMPDGRFDIKGRVVEWDRPRRLSVTWEVDFAEFRELPACLVTYDIEPMGESVRLTMTEAHQWAVPDAILAGGRQGWPLILSGLKRHRDRQADRGQRQDGAAAGDAGRDQGGGGEEAVARGLGFKPLKVRERGISAGWR